MAEGLDNTSFEEPEDLLRLVVDRITVQNETVRIETVIPNPDDVGQLRARRGDDVYAITPLGVTLQAGLHRGSGNTTLFYRDYYHRLVRLEPAQ